MKDSSSLSDTTSIDLSQRARTMFVVHKRSSWQAGIRGTLIGVLILAASGIAQGQIDFSKVEIKTTRVATGIHMLEGAGGNICVSAGDDGVFLVDDQYAPLTSRITAAIATLSDKPIRFVLNTHYHPDHTGGNENLGEAGVVIVAHDNVRERLEAGIFIQFINQAIPPAPRGALPIVTYSDTVTFHMNGEEIHAFHISPAHTDGDSFVHFRKSDVIHAGDVYRTTGYPVVDVAAGGTYAGILEAYGRLLELAGPDTKIIPGHGDLSTRSDVERQLEMLVTIRDRIQAAIKAGRPLEEVRASKPTAEYDARWGSSRMKGDALVELVYNELAEGSRK